MALESVVADSPTPEVAAERIGSADGSDRSTRGHAFRYHLAAGFIAPGDTVIDAACGIGYGAEILGRRGGVRYVGVDRDLAEHDPVVDRTFIEADLQQWCHDFAFDVFVGFETIEHLGSYEHYIATAKQARRWIVLSVPVVPTTHLNPWHLHNFAPGEVADLVCDDQWSLFQSVLQPAELSEIYVFSR